MESEKEKTMNNCKRVKYTKYFPVIKIELVKCAGLHGIMATYIKPYTQSMKLDTIELYVLDHMVTCKWTSNLICVMFWCSSTSKLFSLKIYLLYGICLAHAVDTINSTNKGRLRIICLTRTTSGHMIKKVHTSLLNSLSMKTL